MKSPSSDAVLGAGMTCLVGGVVFFLWRGIGPAIELKSEVWAAWVQAFGSVVAIAAAIRIASSQARAKSESAKRSLYHVAEAATGLVVSTLRYIERRDVEQLQLHAEELSELIRFARAIDVGEFDSKLGWSATKLITRLVACKTLVDRSIASTDPARVESDYRRYMALVDNAVNELPGFWG